MSQWHLLSKTWQHNLQQTMDAIDRDIDREIRGQRSVYLYHPHEKNYSTSSCTSLAIVNRRFLMRSMIEGTRPCTKRGKNWWIAMNYDVDTPDAPWQPISSWKLATVWMVRRTKRTFLHDLCQHTRAFMAKLYLARRVIFPQEGLRAKPNRRFHPLPVSRQWQLHSHSSYRSLYHLE